MTVTLFTLMQFLFLYELSHIYGESHPQIATSETH